VRNVRSRQQRFVGWVAGVVAPPALALTLVPLRGSLNLVSDALLFLVASVVVATIGGLLPSLVAAFEGAFLLNYFFTVPLRTLTIADPNNAIALAVFIGVSATVSVAVDLIARHRRRLDDAAATEVVLTQANELRTALLAAVGHDLRSPLAAAKASVSGLLSPELDLSSEDERELLDTADEALDRLAALIANLLDMSRLQTGSLAIELEPVDVEEVLIRARREVGPADVRILVPEHLSPVMADPGLLERIFVNVLANAVQFSPAGIPPRIHGAVVGDQIEVSCIDHGPGVPADQLADIFVPFQRLGDTDPSTGLGLGLALSRGLAAAMDGQLDAEPTPGGGLTVVLTLKSAASTGPGETGARERQGLQP
jgi:two-component system sensor histidine kinase KdpD